MNDDPKSEDRLFGEGILKDKNTNAPLRSPNFIVLFHELGGHGYYKHVALDKDQGMRTIEYENKVRALNDLGVRDWDMEHAPPEKPHPRIR